MTSTHTLRTPSGTLVYDVRGPLPPDDGRPPLVMVGSPMDAGGFAALASHFADRTVVTYDPRGLGRSTRTDGSHDLTPETNADDIHAVIEAVGGGPVELFASSGGAVSALALVAAHPEDVSTLVAHEPPMIALLPDAERAFAAERRVHETYQQRGWGHAMAAFIAFTSHRGEITDEFLAAPLPEPAAFGLPEGDDGARTDPLVSGLSDAISAYRPDAAALAAAPTRIVVGVGEESDGVLTGRTSRAAAELLGGEAVVFPSHHGGFVGAENGWGGKPAEFAVVLREVLDQS